MTSDAAPPEPEAELLPPTRRRGLRWVAVGALVIATVTGVAVVARSGGRSAARVGAEVGAVAPDFALTDLRDRTKVIKLSDSRGTPVVLNFFASWCTPCRKEMPALQAAAKRYEGRVAFIGIDHKDSRSEALDLLESTGVGYPTAFDQKGEVLRRYVLPDALPITIFLDAEGTVVDRKLGELSTTKLDAAIDRLLAA